MRWATTDEGPDGLFPVMDLFAGEYGTGRMSQLEFLPVLAHRVLNHLPNTPWASWTINAYRGCSHACVFCFARPTHEYLGLNAGSDFDTKIVVKRDAAPLLREAFDKPSWRGEMVMFSGFAGTYHTDTWGFANGTWHQRIENVQQRRRSTR